jgi:hypothetical protein
VPNELKEWDEEAFDLFYHQDPQESGSREEYIHYVRDAVDTLISHSEMLYIKFVAARVKDLG